MDFAGIFDKNFFSFAGMLGGAPGGGLLPLGGASLAAASGQPHAGENYALLASGACADDVEKAARFFAERGAEFVTPWLPQTPHSIARTLEERGIERRRIYTSMYLPVEAERGHGSPEVAAVTAEDAARWGEAAWYAFGGEAGEAAKAYVPFGEYLANHPKNRAFALEEQGRYVSTALILLLARPAAWNFLNLGGWLPPLLGVCVALILARELIVSGLRMVAAVKGAVLAADMIGKVKTTVQDIAVAALLAGADIFSLQETAGAVVCAVGLIGIALATVLTVWSGAVYLIKNRNILKEKREE